MTSTIITGARFAVCLIAILFASTIFAQQTRIAREIEANASSFANVKTIEPLRITQERSDAITTAAQAAPNAVFFQLEAAATQYIIAKADDFLRMEMPLEGNSNVALRLKRAAIFTPEFKVTTATGGDAAYPFDKGEYYWGVVEGHPQSLVAISFLNDEMNGFIQLDNEHYSLGKLEGDISGTHILYKTNDLPAPAGVSCFTDDSHVIGRPDDHTDAGSRDANNCIRMYIQVDYDMFVAKGGVAQAASYVTGAFSQVALMYANESINLTVNEIFVWNTADPFTGPTTSNYLTQFRNYLNGSFNGDLAHLVGTNGGGGIAYLDVLCNGFYSVGYSDVNLTYENVPTYSWTVMVLTHEIGHNIASPHTHACAWNGNNTAIDGCGPAAGYSEGCDGPIPVKGTVMSYCHLVVGIDMALGFGPEPGDLIRSSTYNASCLASCGPAAQNDAGITAIAKPLAFPCENPTAPEVSLKNFGAVPLTSVAIKYRVDNGTISTYNWTGSLAPNSVITVTLPDISFGTGAHTFYVNTESPNGQPDENTSNDAANKAFTYHVDWCTCTNATGNITPNPLNHSGSGSSQATINLGAGSKRPQFTISNLNAKSNGPASGRFNEQVNVSYVDGYGVTKNYGTFYGNQQASVNVNIQDVVNTITITLSNSLNNGYSGTLSISFGTVSYCGPEGGCPDDDGDGVCNDVDQCPGQDDGLIGTACDDGNPCTENDVYGNTCACAGTVIVGCGCTTETDNFSPNPLTHTGTGSSSSIASLDAGNSDPTFTISGLGARTGGNPNGRYIERVTVRYMNSANQIITYGVFRGDQVSTVDVAISGVVQNITVILDDAYDGNSSTQLSVNMTAVTSCAGGALVNTTNNEIEVYPNPAMDDLYVRFAQAVEKGEIRMFNALGMELYSIDVESNIAVRINVPSLGLSGNQLLFISVKADGKDYGVRRVLIQQ
jgi:hypothetical protein